MIHLWVWILFFSGQADCKECPTGYYCGQGSHLPTPCPPGTYNPALMQGALGDCRQCIAGMACPQYALQWPSELCSSGHFCPAGTKQPNETVNACPAGSYTDYHNLTASRECSSCPIGQACSAGTGGRQKPPQLCASGKCQATFYIVLWRFFTVWISFCLNLNGINRRMQVLIRWIFTYDTD